MSWWIWELIEWIPVGVPKSITRSSYETCICLLCSHQWHFFRRIYLIMGCYWKALSRIMWSNNTKTPLGIEPGNPWIQGCDASPYTTEKPCKTSFPEDCDSSKIVLEIFVESTNKESSLLTVYLFSDTVFFGYEFGWNDFRGVSNGLNQSNVDLVVKAPRKSKPWH